MTRYNDVEERLKFMVQSLKDDEAESYQIMGDTVDNLRLLRKKIKSKMELLKERGLKPISDLHKFTAGENVVIVNDGPLDGSSATVVSQNDNEILLVELEGVCNWDDTTSLISQEEENPNLMLFSRRDLAVWDYDSIWDNEMTISGQPAANGVTIPSIRESKRRLESALSRISTSSTTEGRKTTEVDNKRYSNFTSSRERRAKKKKKDKKVKGKKSKR